MSDDVTMNYVFPSLNDALVMGSPANSPRSSLPNEIEFCDDWVDFIGKGGPRAISGGTHTQSIIEGGENIVHGDVITHMLTNPTQVFLGSDYFPFDPEQAKALMVTSLVEALLTSNGNIRSASIIGASRPNQSRIFAPGMQEDISSRDDI